MLFNQTPFRSAEIDDGYVAPQTPAEVIANLSKNYFYGTGDVVRRIDPVIGQYFYGDVNSVQNQILLSRVQNPGLLPSSTL